ncbi:MlaA family lipoprotein [Solirhodobacter olei]|uniref:MlaA family lipoprotein n=1 Tax=Solirhodobacter olei TaxID=2493082 RepID=UPI000FD8BD59|nr:VacJ family lipoprotein [Solirhodobacter olei]
MFSKISFPAPRRQALLAAVLLATGLAGCAPAVAPGKINDPYEAQNRENHAFNIKFDSHVLKPASQAYGHALPGPVRQGVSNLAGNLALPSYVANDLLQAKFAAAGQNTLRFAFNTIFGLGGLLNPAGALGLPAASNDFGETLYVWGAPEGAYLEVPFLGPSTQRDLAGTVVDTLADPVNSILPQNLRGYPTAVDLASKLGTRYRYNDMINSILYGSADSYAQERLIYLEKRHHDIGMPSPTTNFDPYEDPYANSN